MASRQRKNFTLLRPDRSRRHKRSRLLETLERRQLLAGPQLIGIQPNEGDLIVDGSVLNVAPRVLTFRFDENQAIDPETFDGIRVSRAGDDGLLGTGDDIEIGAGLVTLGDAASNEVVVRFSDALADDQYVVEVFGFDDPQFGITGLRNSAGELLTPRTAGERQETIAFTLKLGAQIEAVVPQPVVRLADGSLRQNRNEIVVYFNEDPLFVENDAAGNPTPRSAENPRFYQLFLTQDTVRTTDDALYFPQRVVYDQASHTARLIFAADLNSLGPDGDGNPGVPLQGGTFRLRVGTAVDNRVDIVLPPLQRSIAPSASTDFGIEGLKVEFVSVAVGEAASGRTVRFIDSGTGGLTVSVAGDGQLTYDLGGAQPTVADLRTVTEGTPAADAVVSVRWSFEGVANSAAGGIIEIPSRAVGGAPLVLHAVGDTLDTALDVGVFGSDAGITSLIFSESISPQPLAIELLGGNDDPGRPEVAEIVQGGLAQFINEQFGLDGADITDGITEIAYNFGPIVPNPGGAATVNNQITDRFRIRIREALDAWSAHLGIQFRETVNQGITFAIGNPAVLPAGPGNVQLADFNAAVRIDPTFNDSLLIFDGNVEYQTAYGESFYRLAATGIGLLIGLEQAPGLPPQTLMTASPSFLSPGGGINFSGGLEPVFPGNYDILHGQHLYRPDGNDVDLYRFEVDLGDDNQVGLLTAETFAERLPDSSLLDTSLTLFQEVRAAAESDLGTGSAVNVRFDSLNSGKLGNGTRIDFFRSDRSGGDDEIRIIQPTDSSGQPIPNAILVDVPRRSAAIPTVPVSDVIAAINNDPFASGIMRASLLRGDADTDISNESQNLLPIRLNGGGLNRLSRNDDYFSEDSRLTFNLSSGVYYIGVAASGNETYDPTTTRSGFGGTTQGRYDLHLKFEPQVDKTDVIRDLDSDRADVPGTPIDGDADGVPGGAYNFWFQTRALNRQLHFTANGTGITPRQTVTLTGAGGVTRTYEFVRPGQSPQFGNLPVFYNDGSTGTPTPANLLARELRNAINSRTSETGVSATATGTVLVISGERTVGLSSDFRGGDLIGRTIFVDKTASPLADGSLARPFNNIANSNVANAFAAARAGDIVRIVGNGGSDSNVTTAADNFSYKIGVAAVGGSVLEDGRNMEVPRGVTTMIDAGAILKFRTSRIGVGSSTLLEDRSGGALQVLGTPRLVQLSVNPDPADPDAITTTLIGDADRSSSGYSDGSVVLTSIRDRSADALAAGSALAPEPGDWGGIVYRRDLDRAEGRADLEDEGIFLQTVNHAQIRYGGGSNVLIDSIQQLVNPIQVFELRPTVTYNEISFSADAAVSASPDSFEETSFQAPRYQQGGSFTADYSRIGPNLHNNRLIDNSINGLFVRVTTTPGQAPRALTTAGRFDDADIVHYVAENITIQGTPGGSLQDEVRPELISTALTSLPGGGLAAGTYDYRMTFVDEAGFESLASDASAPITVAANSTVRLLNLPQVPNVGDYVSRRLYRLDPGMGQYRLIAVLDGSDLDYVDDGTTTAGILDLTRVGIRARLDASLVVDPGIVLKFRGTRLEFQPGTQLLAEGTAAQPIVFTSFADDRFGSGGTFDTNNDGDSPSGSLTPQRGDWAGLYFGPHATVSLDHATVAYGGGISLLEGGQGRGFAALELHQANARVTHSRFEFNDDAQAGSGPVGRFGRLSVTPATIFVRGTQPIIVGNVFTDNDGSIIDINADSMGANRNADVGRQTGPIDRFAELDDNFGPLIRLNRYAEPVPGDDDPQITGLEIRGGILAGPSIWDDTDIVHLLFQSITVDNIHSDGGLKLLSRSDESLVVKLTGSGTPHDDRIGTGLTASGSLGNAADRIGGSLHIVGRPGFSVVLTSFQDDTVGAGLTPQGTAFTDSNGDGIASRARPNDWRGILLEQYSNDRNVDFVLEETITNETAPGLNGSVVNAQVLGALARDTLSGNDQFRLGFEVEGRLSEDADVDTYSFTAEAGTQIWVDVDRTSLTLDAVVEILDAEGRVLARSDNSFDEVTGDGPLVLREDLLAQSLQQGPLTAAVLGAGGLYKDYGSTNPRDAGLRVFLPGNPGTRSVYFFRIRSASINPDDAGSGITNGSYRFQLRLQEEQEFPGNVLRYTDIRYANHGIHARGQGDSSPFLGDAQEDEGLPADEFRQPIDNNSLVFDPRFPFRRAQYIGNLLQSEDKNFSIGGSLSSADDVDFYQIDVLANGLLQTSTVFDIDYADGFSGRPNTSLVVFYDRDGEAGALPPELVLIGEDSNILDDLAKPLTSQDIDLLTRGSNSTGDPFIGPVSLSEGTYFVGVVADGAVPLALSNPNARREPIESILRIFEDRIDQIGGATAAPPREGTFVDPAPTTPSWSVTTDRALNPGHGISDSFNFSRNVASQPSVQSEQQGSNNFFAVAQNLATDQPFWSLGPDGDIGDEFGNTSTVIPHTTVNGSLRNDLIDIFRFDVAVPGSRVILDIDNGFDPSLNFSDETNVDTKLFLFDSSFNVLQEVSDSDVTFGAGGSVPIFEFINPDPLLPVLSADPYIEDFLDTGTYYVAVARESVSFDPLTGTFQNLGFGLTNRGDYQLHVSVENHPNRAGDPNNASWFFDRSEPVGVLQSQAFDLTGYDAADLPRFYFNYFYNPGLTGDAVTVEARSASSGGFVPLSDVNLVPVSPLAPNQWRQGVASLEAFAGQEDVVIRFTYTVSGSSPLAEGLYLDDFVVGFAERGEMVTGAGFDALGVLGGSTVPGNYQLEIRGGSEHAEPRLVAPAVINLDLTATFDTNDRQTQGAATIVAPHIDQISDGDRFTLSDGVRSVRFEFDFAGGISSGNIRVPVTGGMSRAEIADAIRTAINLPGVQATIRIQASDAGGNLSGGIGSPLVALAGNVVGEFLTLAAPADLPASGTSLNPGGPFLLPVVYSQGSGDVNVPRPQSQLILDSNKISDAFAIGIWTRYGQRVQDPQDNIIFDQGGVLVLEAVTERDDEDYLANEDFENFLPFGSGSVFTPIHDTPRLGPSVPGAVRNLPTLNDSLVGGITPGVVLVNNTVDQAGYAGIKIDGQTSPFVIDSLFTDFYRVEDDPDGLENSELGRLIPDGLTMAIHAAGERVIFEFEDISGGGIGAAGVLTGGGSGTVGGDGWQDGHVPIFYRQSDNEYVTVGYGRGDFERASPYTRTEVMWSIYQSILGSPLVTNGLVELVEPSIGPSYSYADFNPFTLIGERTEQPAVYIEGASGISFSNAFQKVNYPSPFVEFEDPGDLSPPNKHKQAPVHEPPQSFPRVLNNTIYGRDGLSSLYREPGINEPSDLPSQAIDTRQGSDVGPVYQAVGEINTPSDVDFYEVELGLGDRLTVDIDTLPGGADTFVRIFDAKGREVSANGVGVAPEHLNGVLAPPVIPELPPDVDPTLEAGLIDPFVDFTASAAGTYYVAVSSEGNNSYDPLTLSGRVDGNGGLGFYGLTINVDAPRTFTFNFDAGTQTTDFGALIGTTITVTHTRDVAPGRNTTTFEFVDFAPAGVNEDPVLPDGSTADYPIGIQFSGNTRVPDVLRQISAALRDPDRDPETDTESVFAVALGGDEGIFPEVLRGDVVNAGRRGQEVGLATWSNANRDLQGFGHDLTETGDTPQRVRATTETFVFVLGVADVTLSAAADAAGLNMGPYVGSNAQGGIPEAGLVMTNGTSATVLNNIFVNLDQSIVRDYVPNLDFAVFGRGGPHPKPSLVIVTGNIFQGDTVPSIPTDDFNVNLPLDQIVFENADGNNFLPAVGSYAIDSAINSTIDRENMRELRESLGLPGSNIVAPDRDINGVLRADNPLVAPPGGIGGFVFKDRGSNELADFVGPVAIAVTPQDNDSLGIDSDASNGFIRLTGDVVDQFRIQLRDTGDSSDPFAGLGIDDDTVVVPVIAGLRPAGANVTLFEDERLLSEGIDYSFSYDETQNVITLTPLAGTWQSDRAYRIELNNRSRTVLVAPDAAEVVDGSQLVVVDEDGATLTFEFESGFTLLVPEPITLEVPNVGTAAGGLRDGDVFTIDDGQNDPVLFEFNFPGDAKLNETIEVVLPATGTPASPEARRVFLEQIAENIRTAIESQATAGNLDVDVRRQGIQVIVGAEAGATANTSLTALQQLSRTLALRVPSTGAGPGGIVDGDIFILSAGGDPVTFEFDTNGVLSNTQNQPVTVSNGATAQQVAAAIETAVDDSELGFSPSIAVDGRTVYLNLPDDGSVTVPSGQLTVVGISRFFEDGDTIEFIGTDGIETTLEIDRSDVDDGVLAGRVEVDAARSDTASEIAGKIADAIRSQSISGINASGLEVVEGGLLSIGGQQDLQIETTGDSLQVIGSPAVTSNSTIQILGAALITFSDLGGQAIEDGSVLVLTDQEGQDVVFEFNELGTGQDVPGGIPVTFVNGSSNIQLAAQLTAAINAAGIGITATVVGDGQVSLGQILDDRININQDGDFIDYVDPDDPQVVYPAVDAFFSRSSVNDGEVLVVRQGDVEIRYEFEAINSGGGVGADSVPVFFAPGGDVRDVTSALAAALNNNSPGLDVTATVSDDDQLALDVPSGTIINTSQAPTLVVGGVPGGAIPVLISPGFGPVQVKQALINAINSLNQPGQPPVTTLSAEDRGGATLFVLGGATFAGPIRSFALPAIADVAGNPLEANREDLSTQFTILMPTVGLDYGDAPDPVGSVSGRYPTRLVNNGPRHVVDNQLFLGQGVDPDLDGLPSVGATRDDLNLQASEQGELFVVTIDGGNAVITVQDLTDPTLRDGDTITIDTGVATVTLEFDTDGIFVEDHFAIRPEDVSSTASIADAIGVAISESPLRVAGFVAEGPVATVIGDDEDGVNFSSESNPVGILNAGIALPIEVTVTGGGVVEAWIDFNADGDWDDPGEQVLPLNSSTAIANRRAELCPQGLSDVSNIFAGPGATTRTFCIVVPPSTPVPQQALTTYARFRVSREGNLSPTGLALSGEVEDYALTVLPGSPPTVGPAAANRTFTIDEEETLSVEADNGLLVGVIDPEGDDVEIFADDVADEDNPRELRTPSGALAGSLTLSANGSFTFAPEVDFFGPVEFMARVSDVNDRPETELVSPTVINVTINVAPVNDRPTIIGDPPMISLTINEDEPQTFSASDLIEGFYAAGPANESDQMLIFASAGSSNGAGRTEQGGTVEISPDGLSITYVPPMDYNDETTPDTFTYTVRDVPGTGQTSLTAATSGTVSISFVDVNDPPTAAPDSYSTDEDTPLSIAIDGVPGDVGILDNDSPGPGDEANPPQNQTVELVAGQFPLTTDGGGTVTLVGNRLLYTPAPFYSGTDRFEYTIVERVGGVLEQQATGEVTIAVGNVPNAPQFVGVSGQTGVSTITRVESKGQAEQVSYDLRTWFTDPDGDSMTFTVTSSNNSIVQPTVQGSTLFLQFPAYTPGNATLTVTARDANPDPDPTVQAITVNVQDTPDPIQKIGTLDPLSVVQDAVIQRDLTTVFFDPDGAQTLTYSVARLGSLINPTPAQIGQHPLVASITFNGNQLVILLKPGQSGSVDIEIAARDGAGAQPVVDRFTLSVSDLADPPVAVADTYSVPVGSTLRVLSVAQGILGNDFDPDGDPVTVAPGFVVTNQQLAFGTLTLNANGTFEYVNTSGAVGQSDSFTYRIQDTSNPPRLSDPVTLTFNLASSAYQNPLADARWDVNADGFITAIDALRIINFIQRESTPGNGGVIPVRDITSPPPDFLDVNGDGRVSATDALQVVNKLSDLDAQPNGEQLIAPPTAPAGLAATAVTSQFVAAAPAGLPLRNLQPVDFSQDRPHETTGDRLLAAGLEIAPIASDRVAAELHEVVAADQTAADDDKTDAGLLALLEDLEL